MPSTIDFIRRVAIGVIWLGFIIYIIWLAPLDQPETLPIVQRLLTFQGNQVNAYLLAIFWMMGVWPMIYAGLMFADGRMQRLPAFIYFLAANGTGIVGLAPYLILRERNQAFYGDKDRWLQFLDSHQLGLLLSGCTIALFAYALGFGDWQEFIDQWHTVPFVHLITLDFCFMGLLFPLTTLLEDDLARRGWRSAPIFWAIALLPLLGPLLYLCLRPSLPPAQLSKPSLQPD